MAKTKTTPNYEFRRCPMCSYSARSEEDYKGHVFKCAMRTFQCPVCDFCNNKEANLKRHMKRCHPGLAKEEVVKLGSKEDKCEEVREQREDDWLAQDPGDLIGEISDEDSDKDDDGDTTSDKEAESQEKEVDESLLEGRMFRKPTTPSLPIISKRKSSDVHLSPAQPKKLRKEDQAVQTPLSGENFGNSFGSRRDCGTQTDPLKRILTTKTVKKFRDGNVDTKIVSKEKVLFDM